MIRVLLVSVGCLIASALPGLTQSSYVDLCSAARQCDMAGNCAASDFSFTFTLIEEADGTYRDIVSIPGSAPMEAIEEPSTQGFTFSNEKRVYTFLYLLNDAYPEGDNPEFVLIDANAHGRIEAVTLYTGICEAAS
jgi:hypothetical protein